MATQKQRAAARRNIKKAQAAAQEKRTIAHLPDSTRTAQGKQGAKAARAKRDGSSSGNRPQSGADRHRLAFVAGARVATCG
jgi:hypothetical protein